MQRKTANKRTFKRVIGCANTMNRAHCAMAIRAGYLTTSEAARRACVSITTIYRLINRGNLDTIEFGSITLVSVKSLCAYYGQLKEMRNRITAGVPKTTLKRPEKAHLTNK